MNPWLLFGIAVAFAVTNLLSYNEGKGNGKNEQRAADQAEFDAINKRLAAQKAEANRQLQAKLTENIELMADRDRFKNELGKQDAKRRLEVDALRVKYAGVGLRFSLKPGDGGSRSGGECTGSTVGNAPRDAAPTVIQLPDAIAGNLRELALDADKLNADYQTCYDYANKVKP